ncbi:MAG: hypothetical protein ACK4MT_03655 [Thermaurantiacus tibetensis]|uniref:hypothetical protein n=1 Tax=Thermaurantiacus tibetensis TaxID=2759035 RepID=UPI00188DFF77|nr:hypothetical protein [Thermaurantiacus tibetensis]
MRPWAALGLLFVPWTLVALLLLLGMRQGSRLVFDLARWSGYAASDVQPLADALGEAGVAGQALVVAVWLAGSALLVAVGLIFRR